MSRVWTLHHYNPGKLKVSDARAIVLDPVPPVDISHLAHVLCRHRTVPSNCTLVLAKTSSRHAQSSDPRSSLLICFSPNYKVRTL